MSSNKFSYCFVLYATQQWLGIFSTKWASHIQTLIKQGDAVLLYTSLWMCALTYIHTYTPTHSLSLSLSLPLAYLQCHREFSADQGRPGVPPCFSIISVHACEVSARPRPDRSGTDGWDASGSIKQRHWEQQSVNTLNYWSRSSMNAEN